MKPFFAALLVLPFIVQQASARHLKDHEVMRIFGSGQHAVVRYMHKYEFYTLPESMKICRPGKETQLQICRDGIAVPLKAFKPTKTIALRYYSGIWPMDLWEPRDKPFLICSEPYRDYTGPSKTKGALDQFCAVVTVTGDIVYEFPLVQSLPDYVAASLWISADGRRAAIVTGKAIKKHEFDDVGELKEIWIWEYPNNLKKVPAAKYKPRNPNDLIVLFHSGKI